MNKKRMGTVFLAPLICGLVPQASAQDAEPKFNSNGDDLTKIRGVLEEFRQDIIHKDAYALTKLVLNPAVLFQCNDPVADKAYRRRSHGNTIQ